MEFELTYEGSIDVTVDDFTGLGGQTVPVVLTIRWDADARHQQRGLSDEGFFPGAVLGGSVTIGTRHVLLLPGPGTISQQAGAAASLTFVVPTVVSPGPPSSVDPGRVVATEGPLVDREVTGHASLRLLDRSGSSLNQDSLRTPPQTLTGWSRAHAIVQIEHDRRRLLGTGALATIRQGQLTWQSVPEPAAVTLMLAAAVAARLLRCRRVSGGALARRGILALVALAAAPAPSFAGGLLFDFEDGTTQGWELVNNTSLRDDSAVGGRYAVFGTDGGWMRLALDRTGIEALTSWNDLSCIPEQVVRACTIDTFTGYVDNVRFVPVPEGAAFAELIFMTGDAWLPALALPRSPPHWRLPEPPSPCDDPRRVRTERAATAPAGRAIGQADAQRRSLAPGAASRPTGRPLRPGRPV